MSQHLLQGVLEGVRSNETPADLWLHLVASDPVLNCKVRVSLSRLYLIESKETINPHCRVRTL
jgi:hypothetical protein